MKPVLPVIVGPTATGKTDVALRIGARRDIVVLSADSRQIYRHLSIGTGKPTEQQRAQVPHRFVDICDPEETYSAGRFGEEASTEAEERIARGGSPVLVGGSGLYVRGVVRGLFEGPGRDENVRRLLEERLQEEGEERLMDELRRVDAETASKLERGKPRRIIRALEVFHLTGKALSEHHKEQRLERPFRPILFALTMPRDELYRRIDERVLSMVERGLVEEVRSVLESGVRPDAPGLNTVGYKETVQYLAGDITKEEMVARIQQNTRRYAKRQMTWFRGEKDVIWVDAASNRDPVDISHEILDRLQESGW